MALITGLDGRANIYKAMHAPPAAPDPGLYVLALLAEPLDAFGATLGGKPAPFDGRIRVQCRTKDGFSAPFLALIWPFVHSKTSSFWAL